MSCCCTDPNLCPAPGDGESVLLRKMLQVLLAGSGVGGVTGLSVNGGPFQTGNVSIVTGGGSSLLNFTDENSNADGVVWSSAGTVETFRTVGASNFVQFVGPDQRIHSTADTDRLSILGSFNKATGSFLEVAGQSHVSLASIIAGLHDGGAFSVSSAPTNSTVGTVRFSVAGTTGQVSFSDGTVGAPSISNLGDLDTGIYFPAANSLGFSVAGVEIAHYVSTGLILDITGTAATPVITNSASINGLTTGFWWSGNGVVSVSNIGIETYIFRASHFQISDAASLGFGPVAGTGDLFLFRDASNIFAQRNFSTPTAAQTFRWYETFTDASNYSRSTVTTQAGNHLIRTEAAGTGTLRILQVGTGPEVGTDIAGANVIFHSGQPTGNAAPGAILFQQGLPVGASGAGVTALATIWQINTIGSLAGGAGFAFSTASGTNQRAGNATLVAGTVTVANTTVTANSIVLYSRKTSGGTVGTAMTYTLSAGASFTLTSDSALDTSTFSYFIIENP